jgi:hypothetical protein
MWGTYYSCQILIRLEISWQIFKNLSNIMKIHPLRAMSPANRQTDTRKLIVAFCNFVNMHNNDLRILVDLIFIIGGKGLGIVFPQLGSPVCDLCMWHTYQQRSVTWSSSCALCIESHNLQVWTHSDSYCGIYIFFFFLNLHSQSHGRNTNTVLQKTVKSLAEQCKVKCLNFSTSKQLCLPV